MNVATSDPLALVTHPGRGRRYLLTISLYSHGRLPISALSSGPAIVYLYENHATGTTSDVFLVAVHELGRGRQCIRDIFCFSKLTSSQYVNT